MHHQAHHNHLPHEPDPAVERQNARLDQRFESLKSDLTQWFGYMSQQQGKTIEAAVDALRTEMVVENKKVLDRLSDLTDLVRKALGELPPSTETIEK